MAKSREQIVDRQVREWLARRPECRRTARPGQVITVTGEYGSMADTVGEEVGRRLDYTLYDRALIELIAEKFDVAPSLVEAAEDTDHSYLQQLLDHFLSTGKLKDAEYLPRLVEVVNMLGDRGRAVILGRGAAFILGPARALRVRCIAPRELRVRRVAEHLGLTLAKAEKETDHEDQRRVRYVRTLVGHDPREPAGYDLVVSTEVLTPAQAAGTVVATALELAR